MVKTKKNVDDLTASRGKCRLQKPQPDVVDFRCFCSCYYLFLLRLLLLFFLWREGVGGG